MSYFEFVRSNIAWLLAGFILALNSSFGQTFFISIFAGKIQSYFDLSHGDWGSIYMVGTLASALLMVWAGTSSDIFKARSIGALVLVGLSISTLLMALNPNVWLLPFLIFLLRFLGQGMLPHISSVSMSRWFISQRGKALAISNTGYALGEAFLPVFFTILMLSYNWQNLWIVASLFCLLMAPIIWMLLKNERTPQSLAKEVTALGLLGKSWTRKEVINHPLFWYMLPALLGPSACVTSFFFQQVYFAEIKGWTHLQLVALFPIYTCVAIAFNLISGWALDKYGLDRILPSYQIPMVFAFVLFSTFFFETVNEKLLLLKSEPVPERLVEELIFVEICANEGFSLMLSKSVKLNQSSTSDTFDLISVESLLIFVKGFVRLFEIFISYDLSLI